MTGDARGATAPRKRGSTTLVNVVSRGRSGAGASSGFRAPQPNKPATARPQRARYRATLTASPGLPESGLLPLSIRVDARGALPDTPTTVLAGDALGIHATTQLGYRISAVATRDHQLFLVSERPTDPSELAQDILRSAVRFIRGLEK